MSWRRWMGLHAHLQTLPVLRAEEETLIGGQAVIEGVMMRAPHSYCVAVRKPSGEIVTDEKPLAKVSEKYPLFRFPVLRGVGNLGQTLALGIKALQFSANAGLEEAAHQGPAGAAPGRAGGARGTLRLSPACRSRSSLWNNGVVEEAVSLIRIREVMPLEGFRLLLKLTDGAVVERDVSALLAGPVFDPIRTDPARFRAVRVEGGALVWPNGADLCPDVVIWGGPPPEEPADAGREMPGEALAASTPTLAEL